ncbi:hypothetical protein HCR08_04870 [Wolbachia pipientis]|uniref:hypothetical protein n=1 Tax=Wolbachia pipientis TaxID=955 RepID=UPI0015F87971|nr:hypothetical protein [Wolbachia pipientis]MBA8755342.1 hypothetical protein [Wolbachia pipientis]
MLLLYHSHKHISYPIRTIARSAIKLSFLDPSGLCCIASYDGLKIKKIGNISSLLFWYL